MPYLRVYALLACVAASTGCGLLVRLLPCEGCDAGPVEPADGGSVPHVDAGDDAGDDAGAPSSDGGEAPADAGEQSPDGGTVVDAGGDIDSGPTDGGGTDGGGVVAACGTTAAVRDDFDDGATAPLWYASLGNGMTIGEESGELLIDLSSSGARYSYYESAVGTSLLGSSLSVRIVEVPNPAASAEMRLSFGPDDNNYVEMVVSAGDLETKVFTEGLPASSTTRTFSSTEHRYWRILEDGALRFQVSADGSDWSTITSDETPPFAHRGYIRLEAGTWESTSSPGRAIFDDLNVDVDVPFCSASTLFDPFEGTKLSPLWERWEGNDADCDIEVVGGELTISSPQVSPSCEVFSFSGYALDGQGVTVELSAAPQSPRIFAGLLITDASGLHVEHFLSSTTIAAYLNDGVNDSDYDEIPRGSHRWLHVRREGDTLVFQASPDGASWSLVAQLPMTVSTDAVTISLRLDYDEAQVGAAGSATFSGINTAP